MIEQLDQVRRGSISPADLRIVRERQPWNPDAVSYTHLTLPTTPYV